MRYHKSDILNSVAEFTWFFNDLFYVEVYHHCGNFIWSDPDYGGDNSFRHTNLTYEQYLNKHAGFGFWGRDKGRHTVQSYCGSHIVVYFSDVSGKVS